MRQFIEKEHIEDLRNGNCKYLCGTDWRGRARVEIIPKRKYVYISIDNRERKIEKDHFMNEIQCYEGQSYISAMYDIINNYFLSI